MWQTLKKNRVIEEPNCICTPSDTTIYKGADKFLARPDWKNNWKVAIWLTNFWFFFLSGFQKLEFGRCSLFLPDMAKDLSAPR